ncbi:MAG: ABC transporter ATP-binding protein [Calothrix sp. FI2-JRJ7]|nr:ABC transporter ATP-binding protein [Calothrix sp. FI2-JRJ7]
MTKIEIRNLSKTYPNGTKALKNISLDIPMGMFGLLGSNGAGKSSLMRTLATLQEVDSGTITFGDINVLKDKTRMRQIVGYLPQEFGVYPGVSAERLLTHLATLKGIRNTKQRQEQVKYLLHQTNLYNVRHKAVSGYSGGMRQRFGIAQALLGNPKLIIVDEPTAGLDPGERVRFLNLLSQVGETAAVILSTHIVEDVAELCPHVAIVSEGRVLITGSPVELMLQLKGKIWRREISRNDLSIAQRRFKVIKSKFYLGRLVIHIFSSNCPDNACESVEPDLEDIYFCALEGLVQVGA